MNKYIEMYKEEVKKSIEDLKSKDTFYKQIPNLLTFTRLVGALPAGLIYFLNPYLSICMIAFLWFTDAIDGKIATKFNIKSKLGADMDAFSDKIMFLASSMPLLINNPELFLNFIFEGTISFVNVFGRIKGLNTKTVLSGKIKTVSLALTLVYGYLVQFFGLPTVVFKYLVGLTTGLQLISIKDYIVEFKRMSKELNNNIENKNDDMSCVDVSDNKTRDKGKTLLEELKYEREFLLGTKEPDKEIDILTRKKEK